VERVTATHCLDACAVIAYLRNETGAGVLKEMIEQPTSFPAMHVCNLGEVYYDFFRGEGAGSSGHRPPALGVGGILCLHMTTRCMPRAKSSCGRQGGTCDG
jgi:hypothetical protein